MLYANAALQGAVHGMQSTLSMLKDNGVLDERAVTSFAERQRLVDKPENLNTTFQTLMDHLRSRYNLAFVSSNKKRDGTTRKLKIDMAPALQNSQNKLVVKARRSYVAPRR